MNYFILSSSSNYFYW